MPVITPPVVNAIDPARVPNRTQEQSVFSVNADYTVGQWPVFQTQINNVASNVNNNATEAQTQATTATSQATTATTQAGVATTQAGIATTKASEALASATAAANSAANAAANSVLQKYTFSANTAMVDPSTGNIRLNNSAATATAIAIDDQTADSGNPNVRDWLLTFGGSTNAVKGQLIISKASAPAVFAIYNVTAVVANTGWVQLSVTHVTSAGAFATGDSLVLDFKRSGDVGAAGGVVSVNGQNGVLTGFTTDTGTQSLSNKTLLDPRISIGGSNGTAGQVLTSAGAGLPAMWAAGGSMTLIAKLSPGNGAATVSQTGIESYKSFLIFYRGISISASGDIEMQFSVNNGTTYSSARSFNTASSPTLSGRGGFIQVFLANSSGEIKTAILTQSAGTFSFAELDNSITGVINAFRFKISSSATFAGAGSFYIFGVN